MAYSTHQKRWLPLFGPLEHHYRFECHILVVLDEGYLQEVIELQGLFHRVPLQITVTNRKIFAGEIIGVLRTSSYYESPRSPCRRMATSEEYEKCSLSFPCDSLIVGVSDQEDEF